MNQVRNPIITPAEILMLSCQMEYEISVSKTIKCIDIATTGLQLWHVFPNLSKMSWGDYLTEKDKIGKENCTFTSTKFWNIYLQDLIKLAIFKFHHSAFMLRELCNEIMAWKCLFWAITFNKILILKAVISKSLAINKIIIDIDAENDLMIDITQ